MAPPTLPVGDLIRTWMLPRYWDLARRLYAPVLAWNPLQASAVSQQSDAPLVVQAGTRMIVAELYYYESTDAAGLTQQTPADTQIQVTNSTTGTSWLSDPVPVNALFGIGGNGMWQRYELPQKEELPASTQLVVTLTNGAAAARYAWLVLAGALITVGQSRV